MFGLEKMAKCIHPDIFFLAYYRAYSGDPDVVETPDLLKAANDWANGISAPGFDNAIPTLQLLQLANEWAVT